MSDEDRVHWDERYRQRGADVGRHAAVLDEVAAWLPTTGRALDLAGGAGRNALWLARRGLATTLVDVSPVALATAAAAAAAAGLALTTQAVDLEVEAPPAGPWDVVVSFHYVQRSLFDGVLARLLAPGGTLVFVHPTARNLERHAHPSARWLLAEGELARLAAAGGLTAVHLVEGWSREGRHEAVLVARATPG